MSTSAERTDRLLPEPFADLERLCGRWSLPTHRQRHRARVASSFDELVITYDTVAPRLDAALDYLDALGPPESLAGKELCLFQLCLSLADIAFAVERLRNSNVATTMDVFRIRLAEDDRVAESVG